MWRVNPRFSALIIAFFALNTVTRADTASLRPIADTSLQQAFPDNNLGGGTTFVAGGRRNGGSSRGLLMFDIAGNLPAGATVTSASLVLTITSTPGGGADSTFDLRRVNSAWGEGDGSDRSGGTAAGAGQASWNDRLGPGTPWNTPGGDFSSVASASKFVTGNGVYTFASTASLVGDIQAWLDNPSNNFGWALVSELEATPTSIRRFASREDASSSPVLLLQYNVPEPTSLSLMGLSLGLVLLTRRSRAN